MPAGKYLYRVLRDDENPEVGLTARNPEAKDAKVSSHVNGLKKSPYISTTASKEAVEAFYWLAIKYRQKKNKKNSQERIKVVKIDKEKLMKGKDVEIFDLSDEKVRDKYLAGNQKLKNYAKKYEEVLVKGFIPADCITVVNLTDLTELTDDKASSEGYDANDYTPDYEGELVAEASKLKLK